MRRQGCVPPIKDAETSKQLLQTFVSPREVHHESTGVCSKEKRLHLPCGFKPCVYLLCWKTHCAFSTWSLVRTTSRLAGHLDIWNPIILPFASAQPQLASIRAIHASLMSNWAPATQPSQVTHQRGVTQHSDGCVEFQSQEKAELTDTHFPAFIESRAALGFAPVHSFLTVSVSSTVTDPKERNECLSHTLFQKQDRVYYTF